MSILIEMGLAKRCCDCGEMFPIEHFPNESRGDGRCRTCENDYMRRDEQGRALSKTLSAQVAINKVWRPTNVHQ